MSQEFILELFYMFSTYDESSIYCEQKKYELLWFYLIEQF